jgi:hypothetical protein
MSNFVQLVKQTAQRFEHIITTTSTNLSEIDTEDFGWVNHRWFSQQFRMAHVERFEQPKFVVLHTVIFPHITDPSPIFGFDIIASDTKATGLFFDLSPTVLSSKPISNITWSEPRQRPEWGSIFGEHWIACRPTYDEAETICNLACEVLETHIKDLGTTHSSDLHHIVKAQNNYSTNQRKNEHTTRVILKLLGDERGQHFINNILFPII